MDNSSQYADWSQIRIVRGMVPPINLGTFPEFLCLLVFGTHTPYLSSYFAGMKAALYPLFFGNLCDVQMECLLIRTYLRKKGDISQNFSRAIYKLAKQQ